jgi:hypothetical protein
MAEYNAMIAMTTALPNLQQIELRDFEDDHKYVDGSLNGRLLTLRT